MAGPHTHTPAEVNLRALSDLRTPWCLRVAATLNVSELLVRGPMRITELAAATRCDDEALHGVLRHLSTVGVFEEPEPGTFALNDAGRQLGDPHTRRMLNLEAIGSRFSGAWNTLLGYVRTGRPAYHELFGLPFWDDLSAHPDIAASFDDAMGDGHGPRDGNLPLREGWDNVRTVVDVGGGTGSLLAAILVAKPHVQGTLIDLPGPVSRSAPIFEAAGVADRVAAVAQSFFDPLPAGADVYVMSGTIHDWGDDDAIAILRRCAEAARPSGLVVLTQRFPDTDPPRTIDISMITAGGKNRSLDQFRVLAQAAGLEVVAVDPITECRPT
jgi:hypothetical protein